MRKCRSLNEAVSKFEVDRRGKWGWDFDLQVLGIDVQALARPLGTPIPHASFFIISITTTRHRSGNDTATYLRETVITASF
jgi:hypothetical protein